ncbi:MAG: hypothetical protein LC104_06015 [Bacteroidales bacterium]|nr:hypothetical protein [Bacteroidales bacterium]
MLSLALPPQKKSEPCRRQLCIAQDFDFLRLSGVYVAYGPCISAAFQHVRMLKPALSLLREGLKPC